VTLEPTGGSPMLTVVTSISEPTGSGPFGVAAAPDSRTVYVTLPLVNRFDVINSAVAMPVQIPGSPFNLPNPAMAATALDPVGVAIPPTTSTPFQAYFTFNTTGRVGIIDNGVPPVIDATPNIALTGGAGSAPGRLAAIPVPQ
jgi:hypothetical protein